MSQHHSWNLQKKIVFVILLVGGIVLCACGAIVPALLTPGGVMLAAAVTMWADGYDDEPTHQVIPEHIDIESQNRAQEPVYVQHNMLFMFIRRLSSRGTVNEEHSVEHNPVDTRRQANTLTV